ncbi:MAG: UDP-N-acetylmuramoyl-tripeptide--D-alanyl-D-alanine ligase [Myxococcota bacterium]|nr:UDP-N-acetylmuramoyl-tripeptide--D-alanyl-D-alanine ligase [Myxococcota bacterium]
MISKSSLWSAPQISSSVNGLLSGNANVQISGIATDTRDDLENCLFVALTGDRFDAHDFVEKAITKGAVACLVEGAKISKDITERFSQKCAFISVPDTLKALGDFASAHRQESSASIIGLTGSNGKTTTKEMIASILSEEFETLKTEGNYNNLIGLPMTLLRLEKTHECAVIEMGMNARGEILRLADVTEPEVRLITNIGPAHIGELGSIEQIALAKAEIFEGVRPDDTAVYPKDEALLADLIPKTCKLLSFGSQKNADVSAVSLRHHDSGQDIQLVGPEFSFEVTLPYPGIHNATNAAAAAASVIASRPNIKTSSIKSGLEKVTNAARRLELTRIGSYLVVDDCYNANGDSMIAAIQTVAALAEKDNRRWVAVLGEMRELGEWSVHEHRRVGEALSQCHVALVSTFGADAIEILNGISSEPLEQNHEDLDINKLCDWVVTQLQPGDLILVKGSRGARMERFIERLKSEVE